MNHSEIESISDMSKFMKRCASDFYHGFIVDICCCGCLGDTSSLNDEKRGRSKPDPVVNMEMSNVVASGTFVPSPLSDTVCRTGNECSGACVADEMSFGDYVKMAREKRSE